MSSRVEANKEMIKELDKNLSDEDLLKGIILDPKNALYASMPVITSFLADISKSLAVIADALQQDENCDTQEES